jgi:hypothetical protein
LANSVPGRGTFPPGRYTCAEVGQWFWNSSRTVSIVALIRSTSG